MKYLLIVFALLLLLAPLTAATWTGSSSTSWGNSLNWSPAVVPTSTTNVEIPTGLTRYPLVDYAIECNTMTIRAGASVNIEAGGHLVVTDYCAVYGTLIMSSTGQITTGGSFFWESGSTADVTGANNVINVYGNMQFASGSNVQMANGNIRFMGSIATTEFANYSSLTELEDLTVQKTAGTFSIRAGGQPFTVNSGFTNQPGNTCYNYFTGEITINYLTDNNDSSSYGIRWNNGTVVTANTGQINLRSPSSYLNNLIVRNVSSTTVHNPMVLKGDLRIESGSLISNGFTFTVAGDWENTVGPTAFGEGAGRVIFNGSGHQYCNYTETFNMLEVNKSGGALRVDNSSAVVHCNEYDWTAGALDILEGTFTADDLADNGLYGNYYCNTGAVINLFNADGLIGLSGNIYIYGGVFNVFGGTQVSVWPYGANASLTMSGGVLNIADEGITLANPVTYSFTYNITGGTIQTSENFTCNNAAFTPSAGMVEMTGTVAAYVTMNSGTLYNLKTNKTVMLATNLTCTGGITVSGGYFRPESYDVTCGMDMLIYGTLRMNNASVALTVGDDIAWYNGSGSDITAGSIEVGGFWYMYGGSSVIIPTTVTTTLKATTAETIYIANTGSQFGNLVIGGTTAGAGYSIHSSSTQDLNVAGYLTITTGNQLDLGSRNLTVGGDLNVNGTLEINTSSATVQGKIELATTSTLFIDSGSLTSNSNTVPRTTYLRGTFTLNSGSLILTNNGLTVNSGSVNTISGGNIYCDGITAQNAGTFQPTGGTVVLGNIPSGNSSIWVGANNWVQNLTLDAGTQGYLLNAALLIKGNLTQLSGGFDVQNSSATIFNITILGNWSHQGGTFYPRTGRVIFNGGAMQYCNYSETFNILEVNKSSGALRVDSASAVVTIASYDWTAGAVDVLTGTLTINDLADSGMYGGFYCTSGGVLNVTQDASQGINLFGLIQVIGGTFNIYGGNADASWARYSTSTVNVSGGNLIYHNQGIQIRNSYALTYAISGGTISTTGQIYCNRTDFIPTGGTFVMTGSTDTNLDFQSATGSSLFNLNVNKTAINTRVSQSAASQTIRGNLTIDNGTYYMTNRTLNCLGNLTVNADGNLSCYGLNTVKMAAGMILAVNSGGYLDAVGLNNDSKTTFTHYDDGYYSINIYGGGTLSANYVVFEYLAINGLNVMSAGIVGGLHNCTFQNGIAGVTLLKIDNTQNLTITYANFPTNSGAGAKNVHKTADSGSISFANYSGVFAGSSYENDPYSRVFWTGTSNDLQIMSVSWSRPDDYVCAPVTAIVTVRNTGANDIATPFRVDLYKNAASAPPAGTLGDLFLEISSLNSGSSKTVTFTNVSTNIAGNWTSWFRVDTNNFVAETNETNNLWATPINTTWLALPDVTGMTITPLSTSTLRLDWDYPISVSRFNVYRAEDPYFTPGPANFWAWPTTDYIHTLFNNEMWFYAVKAERDLP